MRLFVLAICAFTGCASYSGGLGYRAREAAKEQDLERFEKLMEEAVEDGPQFPGDRPVQTVLVHFLDLAGHKKFPELLARFQAKGWIPDEQTCSVQRARYKALIEKDPAEAEKARDIALERARIAARASDRQWEIDACLEGAPFLTLTSTTALALPLERAADPEEPTALRTGLLSAMSAVYLKDPDTLVSNGEAKTRAEATAIAKKELEKAEKRLRALVDRVAPSGDVDLLARGTSFLALEVERVSLATGGSFLARTSSSSEVLWTDLSWGWVRAMKDKEKLVRLADLGLWQRDKEPEGDAFWYSCLYPAKDGWEATLIRYPSRLADSNAAKTKHCADAVTFEGPFPLAATAKHDREGKRVRVKKRVIEAKAE